MTPLVGTIDYLCINTIRTLSIDAVEKAASGHPGMPMGAAAMAYVLWTRHLRYDPADPAWINRDRFVLSAGHASMLLYSILYLTGYPLTLEDIKHFRRVGSPTAGHPERKYSPGIEATTGPLGQGISMSVGLALAERMLAARFNRDGHDVVDHCTFTIASDGDHGALARRHLQSARAGDRRPPDLRHRERRRPDGGHRLGSGVARRRPPPRPSDRALRRQPHHPVRHGKHHILGRRGSPLRRVRLAGTGGGRDGRGRGGRRAHRGPRGRTSALSHRGAHPHRIRESAQA